MGDPEEMSDCEICKAVAEKVLSHDEVEFELHRGNRTGYVRWYDKKMDSHRLGLDWDGIGQVTEAMHEMGYYPELRLMDIGGPWYSIHHIKDHHCGTPCMDNGVEDDRPARAVFEAALKTVRSTQ